MGKDKQMLRFYLKSTDVQNSIFEKKFWAYIKTIIKLVIKVVWYLCVNRLVNEIEKFRNTDQMPYILIKEVL